MNVLERFIRFLQMKNVGFLDFSVGHLLLFLEQFRLKDAKFSTINHAYSAIAWFVRRSSRKSLLDDPKISRFFAGLEASRCPSFGSCGDLEPPAGDRFFV